MEQSKQQIKSYLQQIADILMKKGGILDNPGLYTGDMGLALFFFHYAVFIEKENYSDYAFELLDKVVKRISEETSIDYKQGLTGIGSAIEYLVQNNYIEADTDETLDDFDDRIFNIQNLPHLSYEEIAGIVNYAIWRMSGSKGKKEFLLNTLMPQILDGMDEWFASHNITNNLVPFL